jgi:Tfp pilus assembly protein PilF
MAVCRSWRWSAPALVVLLVVALGSAATPATPRKDRSGGADRERVVRDLKFAAEMAAEGLWREALFRWERVLRDRPDDARILCNVAVAKEALGDRDGARAAYEKALSLSSDEKIALNYELFRRNDPPAREDAAPDGSGDAR